MAKGSKKQQEESGADNSAADKKTAEQSKAAPAMFSSLRNAISVLKGRKSLADTVPGEEIFPMLPPAPAQIAASDATECQENLRIGDEVPGGDVFFGVWTPVDNKGNSLGKTFNLFAQPKDISVEKFYELMARVAGMSNGFNHYVTGKKPDNLLYDALRSGAYKGEYFIPPKDVLDLLYQSRNTGKFAGTFAARKKDYTLSHWYWSCTENTGSSYAVWVQKFPEGEMDLHDKTVSFLSGRIVRAELRR